MIVYQKSKREFLDDTFKRDIEEVVRLAYLARTGYRVSSSEIKAWKESLAAMAKVLNDDDIPENSGIAIEFGIHQTGKRIDLMLSGKNANGADNVIIVELKQWSSAQKTEKDGVVVIRFSSREA